MTYLSWVEPRPGQQEPRRKNILTRACLRGQVGMWLMYMCSGFWLVGSIGFSLFYFFLFFVFGFFFWFQFEQIWNSSIFCSVSKFVQNTFCSDAKIASIWLLFKIKFCSDLKFVQNIFCSNLEFKILIRFKICSNSNLFNFKRWTKIVWRKWFEPRYIVCSLWAANAGL
jgi:hypothetical protein